MREIKFRAWDGERMIAETTDAFYDLNRHVKAFGGVYLMQYTGLKDKNGKEIYEGDVLPARHGLGNRVVVYDAGLCSFELQDAIENYSAGEHLLDLSGNSDLGYNPWEVLGNVYENPELLSTSGVPATAETTTETTEETRSRT